MVNQKIKRNDHQIYKQKHQKNVKNVFLELIEGKNMIYVLLVENFALML